MDITELLKELEFHKRRIVEIKKELAITVSKKKLNILKPLKKESITDDNRSLEAWTNLILKQK